MTNEKPKWTGWQALACYAVMYAGMILSLTSPQFSKVVAYCMAASGFVLGMTSVLMRSYFMYEQDDARLRRIEKIEKRIAKTEQRRAAR